MGLGGSFCAVVSGCFSLVHFVTSFFPSVFSVFGLGGCTFVEWVVWDVLFICVSSDSLCIVVLLPPFLCLTCFHLTKCIISGYGQYTGVLFGGVPKVYKGCVGGHLYLWATPLLAPVFNHGKTVPGGGRGSRSPPDQVTQ